MDLIFERVDTLGNISAGFLTNYEADFDITTDVENYTNNFQIRMQLPDTKEGLLYKENEYNCKVFCPGTEFGGEISGSMTDIQNNEIIYTGRTWRGMQAQYIIEPPTGQDYLIVSGTLRNCLLQFPMNPIIQIGVASQTVTNHQVHRYVKTCEGVKRLLDMMGLVDLYEYSELTGKVAEQALVSADITTNKNMVPYDSRSAFQTSGLRFGTPAITTRGLKEDKMEWIVELIDRVLRDVQTNDAQRTIEAVREEVNREMTQHPLFAW